MIASYVTTLIYVLLKLNINFLFLDGILSKTALLHLRLPLSLIELILALLAAWALPVSW